MDDFARKLKDLRNSKNLSQQQTADKLEISRSTLGHWEIGRPEPSLKDLVKIADFFGCTIDYLLDNTIPTGHITYKIGIDDAKYEKIMEETKKSSEG